MTLGRCGTFSKKPSPTTPNYSNHSGLNFFRKFKTLTRLPMWSSLLEAERRRAQAVPSWEYPGHVSLWASGGDAKPIWPPGTTRHSILQASVAEAVRLGGGGAALQAFARGLVPAATEDSIRLAPQEDGYVVKGTLVNSVHARILHGAYAAVPRWEEEEERGDDDAQAPTQVGLGLILPLPSHTHPPISVAVSPFSPCNNCFWALPCPCASRRAGRFSTSSGVRPSVAPTS